MSFDLCGGYPPGVTLSETGQGISFSNIEWDPLWCFCQDMAPEITSRVESPWSNDGDGLGPEDAHALAKTLREKMDQGLAEKRADPEWASCVPFLEWAVPALAEFLEASYGFIII